MTEKQSDRPESTPLLPLFYKKVVPLNKEVHSDLFIEGVENYTHTKETNSVYIAAVEFLAAAREYAVVFAKAADDKVFPVVLLGLETNKNLFVGEKGEWTADYVPAYVRRYPFILATPGDDQPASSFTVCIDESFAGFNTARAGQALFDQEGEHEQVLKQAVDFLKDYQTQVQLTTLFCDNLAKLDVLEQMQANVELASGDKHALGGFMCVNRDKLKTVKPTKLAEMLKSDQLELVYAHLASLSNIGALIDRMAKK